jgi:hypothetical protein
MGAGPQAQSPTEAVRPPTATPGPSVATQPKGTSQAVPQPQPQRSAPPQAAPRRPERRSEAAPRAIEPRVTSRVVANSAPPAAADVRPSFECAKARSRAERLICSDAELAQLDRDTGRLYARAKAATRDPLGFRRENEREWKQREAACRDKPCLVAWYANRRAQLQNTVAQGR